MLSKNTSFTIATKFIILLANFALVVLSTQIWGSEGRGEIALVFANISIITIFSNIFCGSTVAFHAPLITRNSLLSISLTGAIITSLAGASFFSIVFGPKYFWDLFLISLFISLVTAISTYWLGKSNIRNYNLITMLNPIINLAALSVIFFFVQNPGVNLYFKAYYLGTGIVMILGIAGLIVKTPFELSNIRFPRFKSFISYGLINESNYLIQFLNYRLSYYFIAALSGLAELGVFSIVVSISEAVWVISRSMSAIHFSNVINSSDHLNNRRETMVFARQSFIISMLALCVLVILPGSLYRFIFGAGFGEVKRLVIMLFPGIVAIAVSNLFGHYFAGKGNLKVLRIKSMIGLLATLIALPPLIKYFQLTGACISLNISYLLSSFYLWYKFRSERIEILPANSI